MVLIILGLIILSIALSLFSLRGLLRNSKEVASAKKDLARNRVVYQSDSELSKE